MNQQTAAALKRLNHEFYEHCSDEFSSTRSLPWVGWRQALKICREALITHPTSILDLGCGNGRFCQFLEQELSTSFDYVGVDNSDSLLAIAAERLRPQERGNRSFLDLDLASLALSSADFGARFKLITGFGVLHHIPGYDLRRRLIHCLVEALEPEGLMILSFWQFGSKNRFLDRAIPWPEHNHTAAVQIDLEELEAGDYLLPWGNHDSRTPDGSPQPRRYCHYSSPEESARLIDSFPLEVIGNFFADGKTNDLNLYYILRKTS